VSPKVLGYLSYFLSMPNKFQSLIQRIIGVNNALVKQETTTSPEKSSFFIRDAYGQSEPPPMGTQALIEAYSYSWVYFCVSRIASNLANIDLLLYEQSGDKTEEIPEHEVLDLLDKANDVMTFYDLVELYSIYMDTAGECFWWKRRNNRGEIISIYPWLQPNLMEVVPGKEEFVAGYVYSVPGTNRKVPFDAKDIIHFKYTNPTNPYRGLSPLKAAELSIATDKQAAKWNWRFFSNEARPDVVIEMEGTLSQEQYDRIHNQWGEAHRGTANAHKMTILEGGAKVSSPLGITQKDMDFLEQRKYSRDEIFIIFGVPIGLVVQENSNRAVADTAKAVFINETIIPKMKKFVSTLNEFLLPEYDDAGKLSLDFIDPTIEDAESKANFYKVAVNNGIMSVNEIRTREGLPLIKDGNALYLPANLTPIGMVDEVKSPTRQLTRKRRTKEKVMKGIIAKELKKYEKTDGSAMRKKDIKAFEILSKMKVKEEEKLTPSGIKESDKQLHWQALIKKTNANEAKMKIMLQGLFDQQRENVLPTIKGRTRPIDYKFDTKVEAKIFVKEFEPFVQELIAEHGEDAFEMLGMTGFVDVNASTAKYMETDGLAFCKSVNVTTKEKISKQIAVGMEQGESINQIRKRIDSVFVVAIKERSLVIARTEVARSTNFAIVEAYKQSKVVASKEWLTALDERVCAICMSMHGEVVAVNKSFSAGPSEPPAHPLCRCTTLPVLKKKEVKKSSKKTTKKIVKKTVKK